MFGGIGFQEMVIIGVLAVLLFGKRLPEVARSVGQSYQQFRKGLSDLQSSISTESDSSSSHRENSHSGYISPVDEYEDESAPRFEVPPAADEPMSANDQSANDHTGNPTIERP